MFFFAIYIYNYDFEQLFIQFIFGNYFIHLFWLYAYMYPQGKFSLYLFLILCWILQRSSITLLIKNSTFV